MQPEFLEKQRETILKKIDQLQAEVSEAKYDEIGDAPEDNALEYEEFQENVAVSNEAKVELELLKHALIKIDEGKYGICEQCGGPIEPGRLEASPEAKFCVAHAK